MRPPSRGFRASLVVIFVLLWGAAPGLAQTCALSTGHRTPLMPELWVQPVKAPVPIVTAQSHSASYSRAVRGWYYVSVASSLSMGAADLATTHRNVEVGFVERNVILKDQSGKFDYTRKAAFVVGLPLTTHYTLYRRGHPKLAILANFAAAGVQGVAAANNEILYRTVTPDGRPIQRRRAFRVGFRF